MITRIDLVIFAALLIGTVSCDNAIFEGKGSASKNDQSDDTEETGKEKDTDDDADDADDADEDDSESEDDKETSEKGESDVDSLPPVESLGKFEFKVASTKSDNRYFLSGLSSIKYEGDTMGEHSYLEICEWDDAAANWDIYRWNGADAEAVSNLIIKAFGYKAASYLLVSGNDPNDKVICEPNESLSGWEKQQNPSPASPSLSSTWLDFSGRITSNGQAQRSVANRYVAPLAEPCALLEDKPDELPARLRDILAKKIPASSQKTAQSVCVLAGY
jgi:hypothetical protein